MAAQHDEDYAADPVPDAKRIAWHMPFFAEMGIATALFFMQVTSILTLRFGSRVALIAIIYSTVASAIVGFGIVRISVRTGYGMNLLARRVLGFRGAALFSLMFGINSVIYFAAEATIMGSSLKQLFPNVSPSVIVPVIALMMMPLVWFGIKLLAKLQLWTFILYGVLLIYAFYMSIVEPAGNHNWLHYMPSNAPALPVALLAAIGTMNSVLFTGGLVSADYARFVRRADIGVASMFIGVGFQAFCFAFSGLLGLWFSVRYLDNNPGSYFVTMLAGWGTVFAIATQLRINLTNMYSGSMSFLNVFRQVANMEVSRHLMVVLFGFSCAIAMVFHLLSNLTVALGVIGMFMTCFTCLVLVDFYILRPINHAEEAVSASADWRWPAVVSLIAATASGGFLQLGMFGPAVVSMASLIAAAGQTALYIFGFSRRRSAVVAPGLGS